MSDDGLDAAAQSFSNEVAPASKPRDSGGNLIQVNKAPEPIFGPREVEGDPSTGDTDDGGDDQRLRAREREIADGHERVRRPTQDAKNLRRTGDDEEDDFSGEAEQIGNADVEAADADEVPADEDGDEKYEVTVDGAVHHVSLKEALRGYVRTATFHQRATQLNQYQAGLEEDAQRIQQHWNAIIKARQDFEQDLANLVPTEPNWDQEFARDPHQAHMTQKIFQTIYSKLAQSRNYRAQMEQWRASENDRRVHKYAVDGFSKFVMDNKIPDEPTLQKEIQSMRRTAAAAGFSEYEVATVYDPRMLSILRKASKYDRMMANRPRAIQPSKGKTMSPGAATPFGNVRRSGFDDAQRRLASSGKMSDAVDVFRRML